MRIGLMLRALGEKGGIGVYTGYITEELLNLDRENQYVLYYRSADLVGRFARFQNVTERVLEAPNKALWDQIRMPWACRQDRLDVVFHPKFTVPLLAPCKTVMVLHGAGWFLPNAGQYWGALDLKYVNTVMPLYCRKASAIISVSQLTTETYNRVFKLSPGKVQTVYFGPGRQFKPVEDQETLQRVKSKYDLPDRFVLTLSKYGGGSRKNIGGVLQAFALFHGQTPHKLVIGGKDCHRFRADYQIPEDGYGQDIVFPDWIEQEDLPAVYSLSDLYLYPSNMEAFPIPITEAMACGTPIITSNLNGLKEIAGDAAIFVSPGSPEEIARAMTQVLSDPDLQSALSAKGLARAEAFSWEKCARQTLNILESVVG